MLKDFSKEMRNNRNIYYKDEIMIRSPQNRPIHLLTVSSFDDK
jgi:hypothetical protein